MCTAQRESSYIYTFKPLYIALKLSWLAVRQLDQIENWVSRGMVLIVGMVGHDFNS
jgi:hypothetical protein